MKFILINLKAIINENDSLDIDRFKPLIELLSYSKATLVFQTNVQIPNLKQILEGVFPNSTIILTNHQTTTDFKHYLINLTDSCLPEEILILDKNNDRLAFAESQECHTIVTNELNYLQTLSNLLKVNATNPLPSESLSISEQETDRIIFWINHCFEAIKSADQKLQADFLNAISNLDADKLELINNTPFPTSFKEFPRFQLHLKNLIDLIRNPLSIFPSSQLELAQLPQNKQNITSKVQTLLTDTIKEEALKFTEALIKSNDQHTSANKNLSNSLQRKDQEISALKNRVEALKREIANLTVKMAPLQTKKEADPKPYIPKSSTAFPFHQKPSNSFPYSKRTEQPPKPAPAPAPVPKKPDLGELISSLTYASDELQRFFKSAPNKELLDKLTTIHSSLELIRQSLKSEDHNKELVSTLVTDFISRFENIKISTIANNYFQYYQKNSQEHELSFFKKAIENLKKSDFYQPKNYGFSSFGFNQRP